MLVLHDGICMAWLLSFLKFLFTLGMNFVDVSYKGETMHHDVAESQCSSLGSMYSGSISVRYGSKIIYYCNMVSDWPMT
jgi:hypothetical protein